MTEAVQTVTGAQSAQVDQDDDQQDQEGTGNDALAQAIAQLTQALAPKDGPADTAVAPTGTPASLNDFDPNSIKDPALRTLASAFKYAGGDALDVDRAIGKALEGNNKAMIDVAYLQSTFKEKAAGMISIAESLIEGANEFAMRVQTDVHALAGGAENWAACTTAFNASAPSALANAVKMLLDSGDASQARDAAQIVVAFAKSTGKVSLNTQTQQVRGSIANAGQNGPMSAEEFKAAVFKLNKQDGNYAQQCADLQARRKAGMAQGK